MNAFSQEEDRMHLTATQALLMAVNKNFEIEIARTQPMIENQNVLSGYAPFDRYLFADLNRSGTNQQTRSFFEGGAESVRNESRSGDVGFKQRIPAGLGYQVSLSSNRTDTNSPFASFNPSWRSIASLSVTMPLLRDFGRDANTVQVRIYRNNRQISVYEFERQLNQVLVNVYKSYYELVFARENLKLTESLLESSRRLLYDNERKFEQGVIAKVDVTYSQSQVSTADEKVLLSKKASDDSNDMLIRQFSPGLLASGLDVDPTDPPKTPGGEMDENAFFQEAVQIAMANRPELKSMKKSTENQDELIKKAENDLKPKLGLTAQLSYNGTNGGFSDSVSDMTSLKYADLMAGVSFEWSLDNTAPRADMKKAQLERQKIAFQTQNLEAEIQLQVRRAIRDLKVNSKRAKLADERVQLAKEKLAAEQARYQQGMTTVYYVLLAQNELLSAQVDYARACVDFTVSQFLFEQAKGTLLESLGISVDDALASNK